MKNYEEYKTLFSTDSVNRKRSLNTFRAYFLNNQIEAGSYNQNSEDINKDYLFSASDGAVFGKYHNFILTESGNYTDGVWSVSYTHLKDRFCIGISPECKRICDYPDAFKKAGKVLEYRIISKNRSVLYYNEISEYMKGLIILGGDDEKNICRMLSQKDTSALREFVFSLADREFSADTKFVYDISIEAILIINKYINENIEYESDFNEYTFKAIRKLLYKNSEEAIKEVLSDYIDNAISKINESEPAGEHMLITKMKKYINEHYGEYITLETISKEVYAHPVYLSKLFREKTGMNFIDYLTEVRINNAKEFLKNPDCKIYDISYMVGYESSKHFSKVFKNATGMTPKEYREKLTDV